MIYSAPGFRMLLLSSHGKLHFIYYSMVNVDVGGGEAKTEIAN